MNYPALNVCGIDHDLVLAVADECEPTAAEVDGQRLTLFFSTAANRDRAQQAIARAWPGGLVTAREIDDEDWARRSQEHLPPVHVGRIVVLSPGATAETRADVVLVIQPSTGFGTGHHATTRLCLAGLQALDLAGRFVVDVGTGSGVLAMAARLFGAREAVGIDCDADAVRAARENLPLNPGLDRVRFEVGDLAALGSTFGVLRATFAEPRATFGFPRASQDQRHQELSFSAADIVTANLTAWHLANHADTLLALLREGGALVASGMLCDERDLVVSAFAGSVDVVWKREDDGWAGLVLRKR